MIQLNVRHIPSNNRPRPSVRKKLQHLDVASVLCLVLCSDESVKLCGGDDCRRSRSVSLNKVVVVGVVVGVAEEIVMGSKEAADCSLFSVSRQKFVHK